MKFFTSDWHHEHKKIVEFTNRGVDTTQERHTEWLVETWNRQVKPGDLVHHLGDWSFSKDYKRILEFTRRLNGQKILIKGNHCQEKTLDKLFEDGAISAWYTYKEIMLQGHKVILFHFPIGSWHQQSRGSFHLHGHCFDEETEVLTESGFKKKNEILENDRIATLNTTTGFTEYQNFTQKIDRDTDGTQYCYDGNSLSFSFTEKHRVYTTPHHKKGDGLEVNTIDTIKGNHLFPVNAENNKPDYPISDLFLQLYVQIATDGSFENSDLVRFHLKKQRKIDRLSSILTELGIKFSCNHQKSGTTKINFNLPLELCGLTIKPLDRKLVMSLSARQVKILLEEYRVTDGCFTGQNSIQISTAKESEANLLQEVLVTSGFCCNKITTLKQGKYTGYVLSVNTRKMSIVNTKKITKQAYTGKVWCLTVPNSTLIIRRNGKVHVTGNCHGGYKETKGRMLDVGLDSAYNCTQEHRLFDEDEIVRVMLQQDIYVNDFHRSKGEI